MIINIFIRQHEPPSVQLPSFVPLPTTRDKKGAVSCYQRTEGRALAEKHGRWGGA